MRRGGNLLELVMFEEEKEMLFALKRREDNVHETESLLSGLQKGFNSRMLNKERLGIKGRKKLFTFFILIH